MNLIAPVHVCSTCFEYLLRADSDGPATSEISIDGVPGGSDPEAATAAAVASRARNGADNSSERVMDALQAEQSAGKVSEGASALNPNPQCLKPRSPLDS